MSLFIREFFHFQTDLSKLLPMQRSANSTLYVHPFSERTITLNSANFNLIKLLNPYWKDIKMIKDVYGLQHTSHSTKEYEFCQFIQDYYKSHQVQHAWSNNPPKIHSLTPDIYIPDLQLVWNFHGNCQKLNT